MAIVALLAAGMPASAQVPTNFSGTWVRVDSVERTSVTTAGDAAFRVGDMGTGWGTGASPLTITQRTDSLIIEYVFFSTYDLQPPIRLAFAMNGSESVNAVMIGHATSVQRSRVFRDSRSLVVATRLPVPTEVGSPGGQIEVEHSLTLVGPDLLGIVLTRVDAPGKHTTMSITRYARR